MVDDIFFVYRLFYYLTFYEPKNYFNSEYCDSDSEGNFELLKQKFSKIIPTEIVTGATVGQAQVSVDVSLIKYFV